MLLSAVSVLVVAQSSSEIPEGLMNNSVYVYSSMTEALEGNEWSAICHGRNLKPGKARYTLYRRLGWPHGRSGWAENLASPGFDPLTLQPVVSRYTD